MQEISLRTTGIDYASVPPVDDFVERPPYLKITLLAASILLIFSAGYLLGSPTAFPKCVSKMNQMADFLVSSIRQAAKRVFH